MGTMRIAYGAALAAAIMLGCGSGAGVEQGDRFVVQEELRESATTQWEQPYSDGFTAMIPEGTELKAVYSTTPGASYFECTPVKVNGQADEEYILQFFVPEGTRTREGFQGFTFSLPTEYIGEKIKAVEN